MMTATAKPASPGDEFWAQVGWSDSTGVHAKTLSTDGSSKLSDARRVARTVIPRGAKDVHISVMAWDPVARKVVNITKAQAQHKKDNSGGKVMGHTRAQIASSANRTKTSGAPRLKATSSHDVLARWMVAYQPDGATLAEQRTGSLASAWHTVWSMLTGDGDYPLRDAKPSTPARPRARPRSGSRIAMGREVK